MIGADNVLAKGDGGTIKHGQLPLRQENVGNVGARWDGKMSEMSEQDGMGKCRKCRSNGGARWDGKMSEMSEQSWSKVGKKMVYDNIASTYWNQGRWNEAEKLQVQVMDMRKKLLGEEHPLTLTSMANLASTYQNQGRWNEAEKLELEVMKLK